MLNSKQGLYQDLVWWNAEFQAYTDGSWKIINSTTVAGIGGFITDKDQNLIFIFAGPSLAPSPREAEREAILFVYKAFTSQRTIQGRLQIRTDCLTLFNDVQKLRAGNGSPSKLSDWAGLISNPNIKVCYSPRENLSAAHDLAVQEHPMPNGNDSGIVIVLRDRKGTIIKMYLGTIRDSTKRGNELWAMLIGLKGAFLEDEHMVKLESDNKDAVKEWEEWKWNPEPNHANVIQQLNQRKSDPNLNLVVRAIDESQNALARYLVHGESEAMSEEEYEDWLWEDEELEEDNNVEVVEVSDDDSEEVDMLLNEVGQPSFGNRN
ncbi:hypothetical protein ACET3Z_000794 [Daucus carota]